MSVIFVCAAKLYLSFIAYSYASGLDCLFRNGSKVVRHISHAVTAMPYDRFAASKFCLLRYVILLLLLINTFCSKLLYSIILLLLV